MPATLPRSSAHDTCRETIRALLEENAHLRESGSAFGLLAERLSRQLRLRDGGATRGHDIAATAADPGARIPQTAPSEESFPGRPFSIPGASRQYQCRVKAL